MSAEELVARHKDLADIERGFRVMKSQLEIAPVYHRLPERRACNPVPVVTL